ncbi:MAG: CRISPR-associated protein Csx3 [Planctomycetaceae bacterium]|jgi:CRISPR-associated protein Csx3|nr:CRISPR-associated protein Csx3 [Planctomycetaceae bacterium]
MPQEDSEKIIFYHIGTKTPITPSEPLPPLPALPRGSLVVIEGRSPIWRYGFAFHKLHGSPAAAVAVYDPRLGAVVVASHSPKFTEGEVIDVENDAKS